MAQQDDRQRFAETLRGLVRDTGMSITELARASRIGRTTVSATVNGQALPTERTLFALARALGADAEGLLALLVRARAEEQLGQIGLKPPAEEPVSGPVRYFDPLDEENLVRSVVEELQRAPLMRLEDYGEETRGIGIYAIYYSGPNPLYAPVASDQPTVPVYVGRTDPAPRAMIGRSNRTRFPSIGHKLRVHVRALAMSPDLEPEDFQVRALQVPSLFAEPAVHELISNTLPIWNTSLQGFPRSAFGSAGELAAPWYMLHGDRRYAARRSSDAEIDRLRERVHRHYAEVAQGWKHERGSAS
ncbi:Eco29kI family restriction endonuclease [Kitasatospora sp. NPDC096147]|uniref:Eco29kI family restriction endonuclease n=1 Tax=Kitasatospora sp. NPDC096147 TaxID=3364093 RepID=UPI003823C9CF